MKLIYKNGTFIRKLHPFLQTETIILVLNFQNELITQ